MAPFERYMTYYFPQEIVTLIFDYSEGFMRSILGMCCKELNKRRHTLVIPATFRREQVHVLEVCCKENYHELYSYLLSSKLSPKKNLKELALLSGSYDIAKKMKLIDVPTHHLLAITGGSVDCCKLFPKFECTPKMFSILPNLETLEYLESLKRDSYTSKLVASVRSLLVIVEKVKRNVDKGEWFADGCKINVRHLLLFKNILPLTMFELLFSAWFEKYPLDISHEDVLELSIELESENIYNLLDIFFPQLSQGLIIKCLVGNFLTPLVELSNMKDKEDNTGKLELIVRVRANPSFLEGIIKRDNLELLLFSYTVYGARLVLPQHIDNIVKNNSRRIVTWFLDNNDNKYTTSLLVGSIFQRGRVYLAKICLLRGLYAPSTYPEIIKLTKL